MGLGATLTFDLWGLFLKQAFKITPSNICLVGRWLRYMPEGIFKAFQYWIDSTEARRMHGRLDRPLHDWYDVRHRFHCVRQATTGFSIRR